MLEAGEFLFLKVVVQIVPVDPVIIEEEVTEDHSIENGSFPDRKAFPSFGDAPRDTVSRILFHQRIQFFHHFFRRALVILPDGQTALDAEEERIGVQPGRGQRLNGMVVLQAVHDRFGDNNIPVFIQADIAPLAKHLQIIVIGQELQIIHIQRHRDIGRFDVVARGTPHDGSQDDHLHRSHLQNLGQCLDVRRSILDLAQRNSGRVINNSHLVRDVAHSFDDGLAHTLFCLTMQRKEFTMPESGRM